MSSSDDPPQNAHSSAPPLPPPPANPPASLKALLPFVQRAQELRIASPAMAYWCLFHALQLGIPKLSSLSADPAASKYLVGLMDHTETLKKRLQEDPLAAREIQDDAKARAFVANFARRVFDSADAEDRAGRANRSTAKAFLAASNFFAVLQTLEEGSQLDEEMASKLKYAKWKAADIAKAIREGRAPTPGPAANDNAEEEHQTSQEEKDYIDREMSKLMASSEPTDAQGAESSARGAPAAPMIAPTPGVPERPSTSTLAEEEGVVHAISPDIDAGAQPSLPAPDPISRTPSSGLGSRRMESRLSFDGSGFRGVGVAGVESGANVWGTNSNGGGSEAGGTPSGVKSPNFSMPLQPQLGLAASRSANGLVALSPAPGATSSSNAEPKSATTDGEEERSMWRKDVPQPGPIPLVETSPLPRYSGLPQEAGTNTLPFRMGSHLVAGQGAPLQSPLLPMQTSASPGSRPLPTPPPGDPAGTASALAAAMPASMSSSRSSFSVARELPIPPGSTEPGRGPVPPVVRTPSSDIGAPGTSYIGRSGGGSSLGPMASPGLVPSAPPLGSGSGSGMVNAPSAPPGPGFVPPSVLANSALAPVAPAPSGAIPGASVAAAAPQPQPRAEVAAPATATPLPTSLSPSLTSTVQKLSRWAASALDYDDVETARTHLRRALAIVEGREKE